MADWGKNMCSHISFAIVIVAFSVCVTLSSVFASENQTLVAKTVISKESASKQAVSKHAKLVGIDVIQNRLGNLTPTGRGVTMGHVESGGANGGQYIPNIHNHRYTGVRFELMSKSSKVSGHADATARLIYGKQGLAPGVTDVQLYEANDWLTDRGLNVQRVLNRARTLWSPPKAPMSQGRRVLSHSWIHTSSAVRDAIAIRRLDHLIDRDHVIVVAGVNNGGATPVPHLLASSYNTIAVGTVGKKSSSGYTRIEGAGRCKPDVVVAMSKTSFSTPVAAAVVARLVETADGIVMRAVAASRDKAGSTKKGNSVGKENAGSSVKRNGKIVVGAISKSPGLHANKAQVIKAVLMAGADKSCGFAPQEGRPLDQHHGAGAVRFDRSYDILAGGWVLHDKIRQAGQALPVAAPAALKQKNGWSFAGIGVNELQAYSLQIDSPAKELCIAIVWHRVVKGNIVDHPKDENRRVWRTAVRLPDLNLGLIRLKTAAGKGAVATTKLAKTGGTGKSEVSDKLGLVGKSMSKADNVEHVYLKDVSPGLYQIVVRRVDRGSRDDTPYALAWWQR